MTPRLLCKRTVVLVQMFDGTGSVEGACPVDDGKACITTAVRCSFVCMYVMNSKVASAHMYLPAAEQIRSVRHLCMSLSYRYFASNVSTSLIPSNSSSGLHHTLSYFRALMLMRALK